MSETDSSADRLTTTDHDAIREWAEERDARPAKVEAAGRDPETESDLRLQFPDRDAGDERTTPTNWNEFFESFDAAGLVFVAHDDPDGDGRYDIVPAEGVDEDDFDEDVREAARERREAKESAEKRDKERDVDQLSEKRADEAADDVNLDNHRGEEPFES